MKTTDYEQESKLDEANISIFHPLKSQLKSHPTFLNLLLKRHHLLGGKNKF